MPLITCPECQHQISSYAVACPQCGFPLPASPADQPQCVRRPWTFYGFILGGMAFLLGGLGLVGDAIGIGGATLNALSCLFLLSAGPLIAWGLIDRWFRRGLMPVATPRYKWLPGVLVATGILLSCLGTLPAIVISSVRTSRMQAAQLAFHRAEEYSRESQWEQALSAYSEAIQHAPSRPESLLGRGNAYYQLGRLEEARLDYDSAITLAPDYALAYVNRSIVFRDLGNVPKGLEDCNRAIELLPEEAQLYQFRAAFHTALGDHVAAERDRQTAQRLGVKNQ